MSTHPPKLTSGKPFRPTSYRKVASSTCNLLYCTLQAVVPIPSKLKVLTVSQRLDGRTAPKNALKAGL